MQILDPKVRRWTKSEYRQMAELGWFEHQRVELVKGEVVLMSPQKPQHFAAIDRVTEVLRKAFGTNFWVRSQGPIDLRADSEPEPDMSVVAGRREDYTEHPKTAILLVEVSESSLAFDRHQKGELYAEAGIPEYWIVNLIDRVLEVYRDPGPASSSAAGFCYALTTTYTRQGLVTPVGLPSRSISVAELLG